MTNRGGGWILVMRTGFHDYYVKMGREPGRYTSVALRSMATVFPSRSAAEKVQNAMLSSWPGHRTLPVVVESA